MFARVEGAQRTEHGVPPSEQSEDSPSTGTSTALPYRVLIADDDDRARQLLRDLLEHHTDIEIIGQARDGNEAVAMATIYQPDVILMDIAMPYLDGIGATHCIKKTCPQTVVIGLTGHFSPPTYTAMRTAGAAAFVCKNQLLSIHETILGALGKDIEWD